MDDRIRAARERNGWTQQQLAEQAGTTRQLVGAVENGRHLPNVAAAVALARALGSTVEELFAAQVDPADPASEVITSVLGDGVAAGTAVMAAEVGRSLVAVPMVHGTQSPERWALADAVTTPSGGLSWLADAGLDRLLIAGCDPALGALADAVERVGAHRVLTAHASTGRAIEALSARRVHGAVVHAPIGALPPAPVAVHRWTLARWQVGLATRAAVGGPAAMSMEELAERHEPVVQREAGASSQASFERALAMIGATPLPGPVAEGHVDVARRVAQGGPRAGVTMEAAARAFDLSFLPLEGHEVELWIDERWVSMPAVSSLVEMLCSAAFRRRLELLGGYDLSEAGTRC